MGQITVRVGGRSYSLATPDGGEARIEELAAMIDARATRLDAALGPMGEGQLLLATALTLADQLAECEAAAAQAADRAEQLAAALESTGGTP